MINWFALLMNSIWILAIALALAVVSIAYYQSSQAGKKIGRLLITPKFTLPLNIAGGVFCLGMALTANRWWEIILWGLLVALFGFNSYFTKKKD